MAVIEASVFPYGDREETSTVPDETGRWRRDRVKERAAVGLALYRSGARAALEAAINSVQAMVDDSAPLSDAHKAVSLYYVTGQLRGEPRLLVWASQYAICWNNERSESHPCNLGRYTSAVLCFHHRSAAVRSNSLKPLQWSEVAGRPPDMWCGNTVSSTHSVHCLTLWLRHRLIRQPILP